MFRPDASFLKAYRFVLADSMAFLCPEHWDQVTVRSGVFLSRAFLDLMEKHLPENLSTHYALIYRGDLPVAAIVAQSLEIHMADLPSGAMELPRASWWKSLGAAAWRSAIMARRQILVFDRATPGEALRELWPEVASDLWHRVWRTAEHLAEASVARIHQRFLVCGNLLSWGPHGSAFAPGEDPACLWPAVVEALAKLRQASALSDASDLLMVKDLTGDQREAERALRRSGFRRFETEPNMVLRLNPAWTSFDDYLKALKSDYRSSIRRTLADLSDADIVMERITPEQAQEAAVEIHGLYQQVHVRQKLRLVEIQQDWIPALAARFKDDFRIVTARHREGGPLLGFISVIRDGDGAMGYYVGFDKSVAGKGVPIYLGLFFMALAQAIEMGVTRISLGRTALGPKAQVGAKAQAMFGYLRYHNPAMNLVVPSVLALLPAPSAAPERNPFRG